MVVASDKNQVMNSNFTWGVHDPPVCLSDRIYMWTEVYQLFSRTEIYVYMISSSAVVKVDNVEFGRHLR